MSERSKGAAFVRKIVDKVLKPAGFGFTVAQAKIVWIPERDRFKRVVMGPDGRAKLRPISQKEDIFGAFDIDIRHKHIKPHNWLIQATIGDRIRRWERQRKIMALKFLAPGVGQRIQIWQRDGTNKQIVHIYELNAVNRGIVQDASAWTRTEFDFRHPDIRVFAGQQCAA